MVGDSFSGIPLPWLEGWVISKEKCWELRYEMNFMQKSASKNEADWNLLFHWLTAFQQREQKLPAISNMNEMNEELSAKGTNGFSKYQSLLHISMVNLNPL